MEIVLLLKRSMLSNISDVETFLDRLRCLPPPRRDGDGCGRGAPPEPDAAAGDMDP